MNLPFGTDKIAHFSLSAFLCLAVSRFLPIWAAIAITIIVGAWKEICDSKTGGKFDWKDIVADMLGIVVATVIQLLSLI